MILKVTIPKDTKVYSSLEATRRADLTTENLTGFIEVEDGDDYKSEKRLAVRVYEPDNEDYLVYFINTSDLIFIEDPEYNDEELSNEEYENAYYESQMTNEQIEVYEANDPVEKQSEIIHRQVVEDKPTSFVKRTVRLKAGVTYDFHNQYVGNLPNEYYVERESTMLLTLKNKATGSVYIFPKSKIVGY